VLQSRDKRSPELGAWLGSRVLANVAAALAKSEAYRFPWR
jgi:hypothetical protein